MNAADALHHLADRCEREEPSRELDCRIWLACHDKKLLVLDDQSERFPRPHHYVSAREFYADWPYWDDKTQVDGMALELGCPFYTSSIDASAALMVPGAMMRNTRQHQDIFMFRYVHPLVGGNAKTEPMARTAAALRAIAMVGK